MSLLKPSASFMMLGFLPFKIKGLPYSITSGVAALAAGGTIPTNNTDITIIGSKLNGKNITLKADDDVNTLSGEDTGSLKSSNKSTSASVGATFSLGQQSGISFQAGASTGRGKESGTDLTYNESRITARDTLNITSGDDTNIIQSQVRGNTVKANIGGDLNIQSLQDRHTYDAKQTSGGLSVSVCAPPLCYGASSVSANFNQEKIKSNYAGVDQQAGIYAGNGGYQIGVKGNTHSGGGIIDSTATPDKNNLTTGTLTTADISNKAAYRGSSVGGSVGASFGAGTGNIPTSGGLGGSGITPGAPTFMSASDQDSSTTRAAMANGTITITDKEGQIARTGQTAEQTIAGINHDTDNAAGRLEQIFNDDTKQEIRNGFAIVKTLGENASTFMGYMASDIEELGQKTALDKDGKVLTDKDGKPLTVAQAAALPSTDPNYGKTDNTLSGPYESAQRTWGMGGWGTIMLTAMVGAASGNVTGSGAALLQNTAINVIRQYGAQQIKGIADQFLDSDGSKSTESELIRGALHAIAGCAGAAATGGDCSSAAAASAATVALNNLIGLNSKDMTEAQKQAYSNLIQSIVGGVAAAVGGDAAAAALASKIEVENNLLSRPNIKKALELAAQGNAEAVKKMAIRAAENDKELKRLYDKRQRGEALSPSEIAWLVTLRTNTVGASSYSLEEVRSIMAQHPEWGDDVQVAFEVMTARMNNPDSLQMLSELSESMSTTVNTRPNGQTAPVRIVQTTHTMQDMDLALNGEEGNEQNVQAFRSYAASTAKPTDVQLSNNSYIPGFFSLPQNAKPGDVVTQEGTNFGYLVTSVDANGNAFGRLATQAELDYVHQAITTGTFYNAATNGVGAAALGTFLGGTRTLTADTTNSTIAQTVRQEVTTEAAPISQAGAVRAAQYSQNWSNQSLSATVENIAGSTPVVTQTASGKTIYANPVTGLQVVYDDFGNYFTVINPNASGSARYLNIDGTPFPNNVPLIGPNGTTQTGVPKDIRRGLTHFNNTDPR